MPKASLGCLAPGLKHILAIEAKHIQDPKEQAAFQAILVALPDCENDRLFQLEMDEGRKSGKKRAPSPYNKFVGVCMKEGRGMKECAATWKDMDSEARKQF